MCASVFTAPTWSARSEVDDTPQTYCYPNEDVVQVGNVHLLLARYSAKLRLNHRVLTAVIAHESGFVVDAYNAADPSYGLGQVMPRFWRHAFVTQCGSEATPTTLMDPAVNICYSAHILRHYIDAYGPVAGIDAYNNGTGQARGYSEHILRHID